VELIQDILLVMRETRDMSVNAIVLLLVGAVVGAIIASWYNAVTRTLARWVNAQRARRRTEGGSAESLSGKIVTY
jgi:tetrahydromethanopterin S-methyltransferase subunit E